MEFSRVKISMVVTGGISSPELDGFLWSDSGQVQGLVGFCSQRLVLLYDLIWGNSGTAGISSIGPWVKSGSG